MYHDGSRSIFSRCWLMSVVKSVSRLIACRDEQLSIKDEPMDNSDLAGTRRREGRRRCHRIEVWVTPDEKAAIAQSAANAGMRESAFLRALGLNVPVRSVLDLEAATELNKVSGDLGRVAGLLKLWLAEKRRIGAEPAAVASMTDDFRMLQKQMRDLIHVAIRGRKITSKAKKWLWQRRLRVILKWRSKSRAVQKRWFSGYASVSFLRSLDVPLAVKLAVNFSMF